MWWPHVAQQRRLVQAAHAFVRQQPVTPKEIALRRVVGPESVAAGSASPRPMHFPDAFDTRSSSALTVEGGRTSIMETQP